MFQQHRATPPPVVLAGTASLSPLLVFLVAMPIWGLGVATAAALLSLVLLAVACCGVFSVAGIRHQMSLRSHSSEPTDDGETARTQKRYDRQAGLYDLMEAPVELLAFRRLRRRLWSDTDGETLLEIGVGTGKNLPYHPEGARSVAIDLSPRMIRQAASRARRLSLEVDLVLADAQRLPFREGAFDAATATFVFCSVPDPVLGLQEIRRVVREGGRVHLLEHVRARNRAIGRLMDLLNPLWVRLTGANINRDTVSNVAKAGIALDAVESRGLAILKLIRGSAGQRPSGEAEQETAAQEVMRDVARR